MLPFVEQQAIFNTMNFSMNPDPDYTTGLPTSGAVNMTAAVMTVNIFLCPSDGGPMLVQVGGAGALYSVHNYLLNVGSGYSVVQNPPTGTGMTPPNGILFENSAVRIAAITDGTSQTVAISETIRSTAVCRPASIPCDVRAGPTWGVRPHGQQHGRQLPADHLGRRLREPLPDQLAAGFPADAGREVALRSPGHSMYNHRRPPDESNTIAEADCPKATSRRPSGSTCP